MSERLPDMLLEGLGVIGAFGVGPKALAARFLQPDQLPEEGADTDDLARFVPLRGLRHTDHFSRLGLLAAFYALEDAGLRPDDLVESGVVLVSGYGPAARTFEFLESIRAHGPQLASPLAFSLSVHNIPAAVLALALNIQGPCTTLCGCGGLVAGGLHIARARLREGSARRILFAAVDERCREFEHIARAFALRHPDVARELRVPERFGEAAVCFCLRLRKAGEEGVILEPEDCGTFPPADEEEIFVSGEGAADCSGRPVFCGSAAYGRLPIAQALDIVLARSRLENGGSAGMLCVERGAPPPNAVRVRRARATRKGAAADPFPAFAMNIGRVEGIAVLYGLIHKRLAEGGGGVLESLGFSAGDRLSLVHRLLPALTSQERSASAGEFAVVFGDDQNETFARELAASPDADFWLARLEDFLRAAPRDLCFSTSGSTGLPVRCRHSPASLFEEAGCVAPYFPGAGRVLSVMPAYHVYGFVFSLLLPRILGVPNFFLPPVPIGSFFQLLRPGDVIITFPFFLGAMLSALRGSLLPPGLSFMCAGAPCPPETLRALRAQAFCLEIYGSTETSAVGARSNDGPYELLPYWSRTRDERGEFCLARGGAVPSAELFPLPDSLEWLNERRFLPLARLDKAVQVGGMNVYPERVAAVLRAHPDIVDCAVRLMRPEEGSRLKAFIVPVDMNPVRLKRLSGPLFRAWIAERLASPARPRHFSFGGALPRGSAGKLRDWDI